MNTKITALGFCSKATPNKHVQVFKSSLDAYLDYSVAVFKGADKGNFGASYNALVQEMIAEGHTTFAIANDDIVLTPTTWATLQEDWELLKTSDKPERQDAGVLACRHDYVRMGLQNVRFNYGRVYLETMQYPEELQIYNVAGIAPILAVYSSGSWIDFPEINWFSDDVQCYDIRMAGHTIWVSRAYCHHIGSQSMGKDYDGEKTKALDWLKNNRPEIHNMLARK